MSSLMVVVFILQLIIHLNNTLVAEKIKVLLWSFYSYYSSSISSKARDYRRLQQEFLRLRAELKKTSGQDEFAKWARLRRQEDKVLEQLEKMKVSLDKSRVMFDSALTAFFWILTNGLRAFLLFWYARQPMFWLPLGLFPYPVEWTLSFPLAPVGSISIYMWQLACVSVILLVGDAVRAVSILVLGVKRQSSAEERGRASEAL